MRRLAPLLLAILVSGCAGGSAHDAPQEDAQDLELSDGTVLAVDRGLVHGKVRTEAGLPLKDARVSILKTAFYAETDDQGRFRFLNVTAGSFVMEVHAEGFQPFQTGITVEPGAVVSLNVTLLPGQSAGAGYVPHVHDYWQGQDDYLLMDAAVDFAANDGGGDDRPDAYYTVTSGVLRPNIWWPSDKWPIPILETPHGGPAIVLPGTAKMAITLSWDGTTMVLPDLGFCYRSAGEEEGCFDPAPSGTTFQVDVKPTMADSGHQQWSMWSLWAYRTDIRDGASHSPGVTLGHVQVKIELTRGEMFLEPSHRRFWDNGSILLRSTDSVHEEARCAAACGSKTKLRLDDDRIVPPGTTRLMARLDWDFDGAGAAPLDHDWEVIFRTGDMNPHTTQYLDFREYAAAEGSAQDRYKVYEIRLDRSMTDAHYQLRSNWLFGLWNASFDKDDPEFNPRAITFKLEVVAHNDDL